MGKAQVEIPDKLYFKIGEVTELTGIKPYVLRYWETEFPLGPKKSRTGQRLYRREDIEKVLEISHLLYEKGFTIAGARKYLASGSVEPEVERIEEPEPQPAPPIQDRAQTLDKGALRSIRREVLALKEELSGLRQRR